MVQFFLRCAYRVTESIQVDLLTYRPEESHSFYVRSAIPLGAVFCIAEREMKESHSVHKTIGR